MYYYSAAGGHVEEAAGEIPPLGGLSLEASIVSTAERFSSVSLKRLKSCTVSKGDGAWTHTCMIHTSYTGTWYLVRTSKYAGMNIILRKMTNTTSSASTRALYTHRASTLYHTICTSTGQLCPGSHSRPVAANHDSWHSCVPGNPCQIAAI